MAVSFRKIVVFLFSCSTLLAQDTAGIGTIVGIVRDSANQPASGIRACVMATQRCATSSANGTFRPVRHRRTLPGLEEVVVTRLPRRLPIRLDLGW